MVESLLSKRLVALQFRLLDKFLTLELKLLKIEIYLHLRSIKSNEIHLLESFILDLEQGIRKQLLPIDPFILIELKHSGYQMLNLLFYFNAIYWWKLRRLLLLKNVYKFHLVFGFLSIREFSIKHEIESAPQGINISLVCVSYVANQNLGGHCALRPNVLLLFFLVSDCFRKAEIANFYDQVFEHYVFWFDVPVNNVFGMYVFKCIDNL